MCSGGRLLMMDKIESETCTVLEDATNATPHGNQRLYVQWLKAPDDGNNSVRNM
jgi:hypothetical protein